jgi:hypothetical protein
MMRNPNLNVRADFIEIMFDPEDTKLGIDLEERKKYVFAILSNKRAVEASLLSYSEWEEATEADDASGYIHSRKENKRHFANLWALAGTWPPMGVRQHVYRNVSVDGETKVQVYKQSDNFLLRMAILENDLPELDEDGKRADGPSKVLEVAKEDSEEMCRNLAYSKASPQRRKPTPVFSALRYGWAAATGIVEMLVAVILLRSATTHFETVTYALLVMIYCSIRLSGIGHGLLIWQQARHSSQRHVRLLDLLHDPQRTKEQRQTVEADAVNEAEDYRKVEITWIIDSACLSFMGIGAALYLVVVLVQSF